MKGVVILLLSLLGICNGSLVLISGYNNVVRAFNYTAGNLAPLGTSTATNNPSWMAFHPTKEVVYAVNEADPGLVNSYTLGSDGRMTAINSVSAGGTTTAHISVHPTGNFLFASNYGNGMITVLQIQNDGSLQSEPVFREFAGANAHQAITDSTGKYLFVVCKGSDYIAQYTINTQTGVLTRNNPATVTFPTGSGPRHMTFHPNGRFGYLLTELTNRVFTLSYNSASGTFAPIANVSSLPNGVTGYSTGAEITITNDGSFVFASNRFTNSIGSFAVNGDGTVQASNFMTTNIAIPRHFTLDPSNNFLLVANQDASNVVVFNRNGGVLSNPKTITTSPNPCWIGFKEQVVATSTSSSTSATSNSQSSSRATSSQSSTPSVSRTVVVDGSSSEDLSSPAFIQTITSLLFAVLVMLN